MRRSAYQDLDSATGGPSPKVRLEDSPSSTIFLAQLMKQLVHLECAAELDCAVCAKPAECGGKMTKR